MLKREVYENLYKAGVIDPTKVSRVALENAASIASMILNFPYGLNLLFNQILITIYGFQGIQIRYGMV
jgi:hypothetical protein